MNVLLYEPDARLRALAAEVLREGGHGVRECSSVPMVTAVLGRAEAATPQVVFASAARRGEVETASRAARFVGYDAAELQARPAQTVARLLMNAASSRRVESTSERQRYRFDLVCIGSSTGGFPVVQRLLQGIALAESSVIVCQHVSAGMASELRDTLQRGVSAPVRLVEAPTKVAKGEVYLLGGGVDHQLTRRAGQSWIAPAACATGHYHPSFDCLIESVVAGGEASVAAMVLSGLGDDGARHLAALKKAGGVAVAQRPEDAVAPGMPTAAARTGALFAAYDTERLREFLHRSAR